MLDVSFSFFDPQPQDYHSIKLLLSQLFQGDASVLDLGGVTDLVLEQKLVGSTVKTDSGEGESDDQASQGDPYAVLTVLNLNVHKVSVPRDVSSHSVHSSSRFPFRQDKPCISQLVKYLLSKIPSTSPLHSKLSTLVANPAASASDSTASNPRHVGLVLNERLVNMPVQVVPPMFKMLEEELQWALEDVRFLYSPVHVAILSILTTSTLEIVSRKSPTTFPITCSSLECSNPQHHLSTKTRTRPYNNLWRVRVRAEEERRLEEARRRKSLNTLRMPMRRRLGCTTRKTNSFKG